MSMSEIVDRKIRFLEHTEEQLQTICGVMEDIRWKFVAGFGALVVGGVIGAAKAPSPLVATLAIILSILVCIAALICLSRVYSLTVRLWNQVSLCQREALQTLRIEKGEVFPLSIDNLCLFSLENARSWYRYWFTVSHASSLIFSGVLAAMTTYLANMLVPTWIGVPSSVILGLCVFLAADYGHYRLSALGVIDTLDTLSETEKNVSRES